jgi:hypothetical protein
MSRAWGLSSARSMAGMISADAPDARPSPGAAAGNGHVLPGGREGRGAGATRSSRDDHDRLAQRMNDVVVRRIFAAGLDLQAALGLLGEPGTASEDGADGKIRHAADELDHAIRDIRDIVFEPW